MHPLFKELMIMNQNMMNKSIMNQIMVTPMLL